jgi:hypothetical protein
VADRRLRNPQALRRGGDADPVSSTASSTAQQAAVEVRVIDPVHESDLE